MKSAFLAFVTVCILSACGQALPSTIPSATDNEPTSTKSNATSTSTPSQTPYPSETPTATEWIKTYPTKNALIIYGTEWRNEYTINFIEWGDFYIEPYFVLYDDGQLIFGTGAYEKQLLPNETKEVLSKVEQLGFFQIQDTYAADSQNPLYSFPYGMTPDPNLNLPSVVLTVNGHESKSIRYMKEWEKYLAQPMKEIITYLNSISSDGATHYQPDRLLVAFEGEEGKQIPEDAKVIPWPSDVTSPAHRSYMGVLYLEGAEALRLYEVVGESLYEYFSFEGKKFNVFIRPILPHECHIYHLYELRNVPEGVQPYFTCDGW
jgi:hypothetical protein